ncbi:MAG: DNA polymerase III subunit alpha [Flavobacteriales bacterium]|nr:DNA polymerase III subunit alpha [Flavobacteriales bacterium]
MYINCHTYYSLRYGTIKPVQLLQLASGMGLDCIAMTDINSTSACLDFIRQAPAHGVRPVVGIDFRNGAEQKYVGIARNNEGFRELNEHLTRHLHQGRPFDECAPVFEHAYIIYPWSRYTGWGLRENEFVGVHSQEINHLRLSPYRNQTSRMVMLQTVSFRNKRDFNAHRLLRAIDNNTLLSKLPGNEQGKPHHRMSAPEVLEQLFEDFPELIENTRNILNTSSIDFTFGTEQPHRNLRCYTSSEEEDYAMIERLCHEGMPYRYPNPTPAIEQRVKKELDIIKEKGFLSYFLINWDITSYARSKGYFYVGRGSGANSVIAYLLRITDVDPIELDLYFERFINLYRKNPPDFDIDFSWTDRDDVTRYIFNRFDHVALIATYSTFQYRAVVRELGKVFGLPKHEIDLLSKGDFELGRLDQLSQLVLQYSTLIQEFPNHLSVHAGGILIAQDPITSFTATFLPPKGYPTTQFDMVVAEDVGLYKFDILSQRGLGKIKDAVSIVAWNRPEDEAIDIHDIKRFKEDERVKHLLRNARAIGCFYVESPAMRMLLRKLQVDDYLGLVAASSVIRPGVARSGMMREYILRFRYPERRKEAHPVLLDIMPETFGVMVYQEDVIKVAHYFAGLDLGEADVLRRGMSGKFRSREEFARAKEAFFEKARMKGHDVEMVAEIWRQVESFAGYAFAKGHSASYAVESYQSLFLKAYYPLEYMVATINNFGGFYRTELYVHEARLHGADIQAPCVNHSGAETVIFGRRVFLGLGLVKELEHDTIKHILASRMAEGPFESMLQFVNRVRISREQLAILIRVGALRFTGKGKKELLWESHLMAARTQRKPTTSRTLFDSPPRDFTLPELDTDAMEDTFDQMELLGFSLSDPFNLLKDPLHNELRARHLEEQVGKEVEIAGYLVTIKNTRTHDGKGMYFGTFLDRDGDWLDTVHFPPIAAQFPFRGRGIYRIRGMVTEEFGCINVEVSELEKLPIIEDPRFSDARTTTRVRHSREMEKATYQNKLLS